MRSRSALGAFVLAQGGQAAPRRYLVAPGTLVGALSVAAMLTGATHVHSHEDGSIESAAGEHSHGDDAVAADQAQGDAAVATDHSHGDEAADGHAHTASDTSSWPRPWDPATPIDFSGVAGVTAEQQGRAEALVASTLADLPQFADVTTISAQGFQSIGDASTGFEHFINRDYIGDESFLDPNRPESLVYQVDGEQRTLVSAMYIARDRAIDDPELVDFGGALMQWHVHENLCWKLDENGKPVVAGVTDEAGKCAPGTVNAGGRNPMVHVWIAPHECGPFAALEGHGAGQAAGDGPRADQCAHDHGATAGTDDATQAAFDPSQPVDLSGVEGVTADQQAYAEALVTRTLTDLPQWADPAVAEAAGFHSIGDASSGHEHYIQWDWIEDDVTLDPDHPESLVYEPQPDGSKQLVSAMYMLPSSVALEDVPDDGGKLMQWHIHDNLCFTDDPVAPKVRGLTKPDGTCRAPLVRLAQSPMIHVWIVPTECGPFAALEGIGAGTIEAGQERWCDHVHAG